MEAGHINFLKKKIKVDKNIFFEVTIAVATIKLERLIGKAEIQQTNPNRPRERLELVTHTIKEKRYIDHSSAKYVA